MRCSLKATVVTHRKFCYFVSETWHLQLHLSKPTSGACYILVTFIILFRLKVISHQSLYYLVLKYYTIYTIQVHHAMLTSRPLLRRCAVVIVNHNDYRRNTSLRIALLVLLTLLENTRDL
jgi:hypothetical protein